MTKKHRFFLGVATLALVAGCVDTKTQTRGTFDAGQAAFSTRPEDDSRGVISYPNYDVAIARQGDTVQSVAARLGLDPQALANYNALGVQDPLGVGEVLALPYRLPAQGISAPSTVDVVALAGSALDRIDGITPSTAAPNLATAEPLRHQVRAGENIFSIAQLYNVQIKDIIAWNGLSEETILREGQYVLIPPTTAPQTSAIGQPLPFQVLTEAPPEQLPASALVYGPGVGSVPPAPPVNSITTPDLPPFESIQPPPAENLAAERTQASQAQMLMPVSGQIIRHYAKGKNDGIDISVAGKTPVIAAQSGRVAAVTVDTNQTSIIVLRHEDNLLTIYAGVDNISVKKGEIVQRGQNIATVQDVSESFLHFEVRRGTQSLDPMDYLQ